jgi:type IV pilus assembly protein PilA
MISELAFLATEIRLLYVNFHLKLFTMFAHNQRGSSKSKITTALAFGGFTLIELLVSIVIIGVLSAIALPSYLNQAAKTRASEAKSFLGTINRSQQAYRLERNTFASSLADLDVQITGKYYVYSVGGGSSSSSTTAKAQNNQAAMKVSSAGVNQTGDSFTQIICETVDTQLVNTAPTVPIVNTLPLTCPANYANMQ